MYKRYTYFRHYNLKSGNSRWQCNKHFSRNCGAYVVLNTTGGVVKVLLVTGRNGKDLLMLNGYTYYQHKILRDGFRWSCTQMGSRSCRAFLHVTNVMLVVRAYTEHTHAPSTYFMKSIKNQLKSATTRRRSQRSEALNPLALKITNVHGRDGF